jgi:hypothetical protein
MIGALCNQGLPGNQGIRLGEAVGGFEGKGALIHAAC